MSQIQRFIFNFRYFFIQLILWREVSEVFVTRLEDLFSDAMTAGADSCCSQGGRREWTGQDSPKATSESLVRHSYLNIKLQFLQTLNRFIIHYTFSYLVQCNKECNYLHLCGASSRTKENWVKSLNLCFITKLPDRFDKTMHEGAATKYTVYSLDPDSTN